jgi:O-antigen/teichoic acid export membrane protein
MVRRYKQRATGLDDSDLGTPMTESNGAVASPTKAIVGDTVWSAVAEASKLTSSIVTFLFVARALGATPFGLLAGIAALVNMVSPFAGLGAPLLMLQRIRHDDQPLDVAFATAVTMTVLGGAAAILFVTVLGSMAIPQESIAVIVVLAVGDFLFGGVLQLCSGVAIAASEMRWYALAVALPNVTRVAAVGLFVALDHPSILLWAGLQLAVLGVTVVVVVSLLCARFGVRFSRGSIAKRDLVDGLPYSASVAAFSARDGLDKPLMVRYGWGVDAGHYAAAYRIPSLAFMPVQALIIATLNRTFSAGRAGVGAALALAKRLMIPALVYSLAIALVIVTCAPLFEPLLGESFEGAVPIVR